MSQKEQRITETLSLYPEGLREALKPIIGEIVLHEAEHGVDSDVQRRAVADIADTVREYNGPLGAPLTKADVFRSAVDTVIDVTVAYGSHLRLEKVNIGGDHYLLNLGQETGLSKDYTVL